MRSKKFGAAIREKRKMIGMSEEGFADLCNWNQSFVSRIENGVVDVPAEQLQTICKHLKMDPDQLILEHLLSYGENIYNRAGLPQPKWRVVPCS